MAAFPEPEGLRLSREAGRAASSGRPPRHRPGEPFLMGPIPWAWLDRAGRLPGKALAVGLVLWRQAGLKSNRTVHLCLAGSRSLGLREASARRGLKELENAGLVEVRRLPGRGIDATLLDVRADEIGNGDEPGHQSRRYPKA
jgi:hypothetical protein